MSGLCGWRASDPALRRRAGQILTASDIAARFAPQAALVRKLLPVSAPGLQDGAHEVGHLLRVWANVRQIAGAESGDLRLLAAATLLHDCVSVPKGAPERPQASRLAAAKARDELARLGWSKADRHAVAHAIEAHSFSAGIHPETLEARVLQDADRLDAIGAIGVARCFLVAGQMGSAICHATDPTGQARPLDDSCYAVDHFRTKLLGLAAGFTTATGKAMAQARYERMQRFLDDLEQEVMPANER